MLERVPSQRRRTLNRIARNLGMMFSCVIVLGIGGCQKTDEELLKERLDTSTVHLYLASKIAMMKADQPEGKKARDEIMRVVASLQGTKTTATGARMGAKDVLSLLGSLYSLRSEGKELLRSGNEKGMKPILPVLFEPNPRLAEALDLNLEHAFLLSGLFMAKFHPDTKIPVPDEIALYEAWMTNTDTLTLDGLAPIIRAMKGVLYGNNGYCDLAGKESAGAERDAGKLTAATLGTAFATVNGTPSNVNEDQARHALAAARALTHGTAALCYKKRDRGDDAKKFIDELDGFLKAADDLGVRSSETVFIRVYVSIQRGDRAEAKKLLEAVRQDPKLDAATKEDVDKLLAHLNDDGFIAGYFDRVYFIKTTTVIILRRLDEVGAFDPIKESTLVTTVHGYLDATTHTLGHAKEQVSTDAIKDKVKGLTEKK